MIRFWGVTSTPSEFEISPEDLDQLWQTLELNNVFTLPSLDYDSEPNIVETAIELLNEPTLV